MWCWRAAEQWELTQKTCKSWLSSLQWESQHKLIPTTEMPQVSGRSGTSSPGNAQWRWGAKHKDGCKVVWIDVRHPDLLFHSTLPKHHPSWPWQRNGDLCSRKVKQHTSGIKNLRNLRTRNNVPKVGGLVTDAFSLLPSSPAQLRTAMAEFIFTRGESKQTCWGHITGQDKS